MKPDVSVVVPTYNERENILTLLEKLDMVLSNYAYEVNIIDDNSSDGTAEIARTVSDKYPVNVVVRKDKRGLASAVVDGMRISNGNTFIVMDADLQHPPEVIPGLLQALESGSDIAIASRYVNGGACQDWGLPRRIISRGATFLARILLPSVRRVHDPMSGFFALKREVVADAALSPIGYKILLETLAQGRFQKVSEVPFVFKTRDKGESKLNSRQQIEYLKHLYSLMRRTGELKRFVTFCLVGLTGVGVNEGLLWILNQFAGLPILLASILSVEAAIISNFTLNDLFTFRDRRTASNPWLLRLVKFNLVSLVGLGINTGTLLFFSNVVGIYYLIANLIGIAIAMLFNYLLNSWWTWE